MCFNTQRTGAHKRLSTESNVEEYGDPTSLTDSTALFTGGNLRTQNPRKWISICGEKDEQIHTGSR